MRRDGVEVGIDNSFTIDPDDNGQDNVVERDGWRVAGAPGFLGISLIVPDDADVPAGEYAFPYDEWRESPLDDSDHEEMRAHYQTLASVIEAIQDNPKEWQGYLKKRKV